MYTNTHILKLFPQKEVYWIPWWELNSLAFDCESSTQTAIGYEILNISSKNNRDGRIVVTLFFVSISAHVLNPTGFIWVVYRISTQET